MNWFSRLAIALTVVAHAGAQSPAPWPPGKAWEPPAYRQAVRTLMALAVAQKPLPRIKEPDSVMLRFVRPAPPADIQGKDDAGKLAALVDIADRMSRVQWLYISKIQQDPTHGAEFGALVAGGSAVAVEIAALVPAEGTAAGDALLQDRAREIVLAAAVGLVVVCRDPTVTPEVAGNLADLFAERMPALLVALPADARRELAHLGELQNPGKLSDKAPAALISAYAEARDACKVKLPAAIEALMADGMPAASRTWGADDLRRAGVALEKCAERDRRKLPRLRDRVTGPLVRRMCSETVLSWLADEDLPVPDRYRMGLEILKFHASIEGVYTPAIALERRGAPREDFAAEQLALESLNVRIHTRTAALEKQVEAAPADAGSSIIKSLAFQTTRYARHQALLLVPKLLEPLNAPPREAKLMLLDALREELPAFLADLDEDRRAELAGAFEALAKPPAAPELADRIRAAVAVKK